ncbi:TIGR03745 family integrating conjugative element membrane protein [Pseudomonas syringae group sp. J309-1]|uniref:TIGR03745 family integrating conjugative element membrane protein n=1 Tax=Pseudomonas syringae group sp. J309-1 TaxID=3079588 RepID=UPI0029061932|nr:TIGR03745 family integrating conjugative element membrane protein [Pseudomonas syringae group sp. J309-1]MDU8358450.1 TIGR03745 family integrating conjugative element membrane protein [Pseudomonas syringae group sp. J309-1]
MPLFSLYARARAFMKHRPYSALLLTTGPGSATAALPSAQAPTRGTGNSFLQTFQNYAFDGFTLLGLCLCAFGIFMVGRHALGVYHDIHMGKAKWADLGGTAVVGVCLIGIVIYLVTTASNIL